MLLRRQVKGFAAGSMLSEFVWQVAGHRVEPHVRVARQKRPHHVVRLLRLVGTHTIHQQPVGGETAALRLQQRQLCGLHALQVLGTPAPLDVGMTAQHPQAGTRRVHEDAVENARPRRRSGAVRRHGRDARQPQTPHVGIKQPQAARLSVTSQDLPRVAHELGKVGRLAARRRAGIQHPLPRLRPAQRRYQHGAFVLNLEQAVAVTRQRVQAARSLHRQRRRQQAGGPDMPQPLLHKALRQHLRGDAQRVDAQRDVPGAIVRRAQGLRARPAVAVQPALHQPLRVRMRHRQMRRRLRVGVRQGIRGVLPQQGAQDAVHQPRDPGVSEAPCQSHRGMHRGARRHPFHPQALIGPESENVANPGRQGIERTVARL